MDLWASLAAFVVAMVTVVECQDAQMHQQRTQGHQGSGRIHDKTHIQNPEHLKEHYDGVLDSQDNLSDDELNFHYFKVHDYDNNNMLDGIELISALTHYHGNKDGPEDPRMPDLELMNMIDLILEEDDANHDGYVDYPEFIMSQRR